MQKPTEIFRQYLKGKGFKYTPERKKIVEGIFSLHGHFNVEELYERFRKQGRGISRASIYRAIPLLTESGLIRESIRDGGKGKYEHVYGHGHHDHLVCVKCGKIIEFVDEGIEKLQERVYRKHNFAPAEHKLVIRGYCSRCRPRKERR